MRLVSREDRLERSVKTRQFCESLGSHHWFCATNVHVDFNDAKKHAQCLNCEFCTLYMLHLHLILKSHYSQRCLWGAGVKEIGCFNFYGVVLGKELLNECSQRSPKEGCSFCVVLKAPRKMEMVVQQSSRQLGDSVPAHVMAGLGIEGSPFKV